MTIVHVGQFDVNIEFYNKSISGNAVRETVREIIQRIREEGLPALQEYCARFDRAYTGIFEAAPSAVRAAYDRLEREEPDLTAALRFAASNIRAFAEIQKAQICSLEKETARGIFTGQRVIPLDRAVVYAPCGRYPLVSTVLMGVIPAVAAGAREICVTSPPREAGLPDYRILAAAAIAGAHRVFALGGAQAVAAFACGVRGGGGEEIIPRADIIAGPGNKYVAEAKRQLSGEVGIDTVAGPTDVLIIADTDASPALVAADLIAQAEHDADARARALVPDRDFAQAVEKETRGQLASLPTRETAAASLDAGGLLIVYHDWKEAVDTANIIAPEHLELHVTEPSRWVDALTNYGSLFIGASSAEAFGDYSAGINHTLPTMGSARFSGGLSVRHFLKIVTTLRCEKGADTARHLEAAKIIAEAEGLYGHARSLEARMTAEQPAENPAGGA
jgi:histidinol dehydrogenase